MLSIPRKHAAIVLAAALLAVGMAFNAARPPAQPTAIAVVDIVAVLDGLEQKLALEQQLQDDVAAGQGQLDQIVEELNDVRENMKLMETDSADYRKMVQNHIELQAQARARREFLEGYLSFQKGQMMANLFQGINDTVRAIADREGYDIVLADDSTFPVPTNAPEADVRGVVLSRSVLYRYDSVDITQQVITEMNNNYP